MNLYGFITENYSIIIFDSYCKSFILYIHIKVENNHIACCNYNNTPTKNEQKKIEYFLNFYKFI